MIKRIVTVAVWILFIAAVVWGVRSMHVMDAIRRMHQR
jgi:hypothetical protein